MSLLFQSTLPCGSDDGGSTPLAYFSEFQSTLPYGSDLGQTIITKVRALISIHAPLRERRQCFTHFLGIFNFNPRSNDAPMRPHFNPRSLAGATDCSCLLIFRRIHFNPRSLAGATDCSCLLIFRRIHFNPRSLTGATKDHKLTVVSVKFQSTLPRGSDFSSDVNNRIRHYFNPRSLAGATSSAVLAERTVFISIHAPLRERRRA